MIQPIQPTGIGQSSGAGAISMNTFTASANGPQSAGNTTSLGRSTQISNINMAVSKMLQDIGGGVQNNKVLQLLIALLILMALLQNMTQQGGGQSGGFSGGDGSSEQDAAQLLSHTMSSNSITIEQTSISITNSFSGTYDASGGQSQSTGQQLDVGA